MSHDGATARHDAAVTCSVYGHLCPVPPWRQTILVADRRPSPAVGLVPAPPRRLHPRPAGDGSLTSAPVLSGTRPRLVGWAHSTGRRPVPPTGAPRSGGPVSVASGGKRDRSFRLRSHHDGGRRRGSSTSAWSRVVEPRRVRELVAIGPGGDATVPRPCSCGLPGLSAVLPAG
jgi:hypothetical protein